MGDYSDIIVKLAVGIVALIIQINILGKGNLAQSLQWTKCKTMPWVALLEV